MPERTLVIIPTFNERENIVRLIERLLGIDPALDVLIVDDGSPDGTAEAVERAHGGYGARLFLLRRTGKGGRGSAVLDGFRYGLARGHSIFFEMDADFSHRPEEIPLFLRSLASADVVVGSRYLPESEIHDWGWKRTLFSRWANRYARAVLRLPLTDYTNGFRCYNRQAIEQLNFDRIDAKGYVVLSEVAYQLHRKGLRLAEVPTVFVNRRRGQSNLSLYEVREAFLSVLRIRSPRLSARVRQTLKFLACGLLGALVDLTTLLFLVEVAHANLLWANVGATVVASLLVYVSNRTFTFGDPHASSPRQLRVFAVVYAGSAILNLALSLSLLLRGFHYFLARAMAISVGALWNYLLWQWLFIQRRTMEEHS